MNPHYELDPIEGDGLTYEIPSEKKELPIQAPQTIKKTPSPQGMVNGLPKSPLLKEEKVKVPPPPQTTSVTNAASQKVRPLVPHKNGRPDAKLYLTSHNVANGHISTPQGKKEVHVHQATKRHQPITQTEASYHYGNQKPNRLRTTERSQQQYQPTNRIQQLPPRFQRQVEQMQSSQQVHITCIYSVTRIYIHLRTYNMHIPYIGI